MDTRDELFYVEIFSRKFFPQICHNRPMMRYLICLETIDCLRRHQILFAFEMTDKDLYRKKKEKPTRNIRFV